MDSNTNDSTAEARIREDRVLAHLRELEAVDLGWVIDFENATTSDELRAVLASAPTDIAAALVLGQLLCRGELEHSAGIAKMLDDSALAERARAQDAMKLVHIANRRRARAHRGAPSQGN